MGFREIRDLAKEEGVLITATDQCQYGQKTWGSDGGLTEFVKQPAKIMTNAPEVAAHLRTRCPNLHSHGQLFGEEAAWAVRYPRGLCEVICTGLQNQLIRGNG